MNPLRPLYAIILLGKLDRIVTPLTARMPTRRLNYEMLQSPETGLFLSLPFLVAMVSGPSPPHICCGSNHKVCRSISMCWEKGPRAMLIAPQNLNTLSQDWPAIRVIKGKQCCSLWSRLKCSLAGIGAVLFWHLESWSACVSFNFFFFYCLRKLPCLLGRPITQKLLIFISVLGWLACLSRVASFLVYQRAISFLFGLSMWGGWVEISKREMERNPSNTMVKRANQNMNQDDRRENWKLRAEPFFFPLNLCCHNPCNLICNLV